MNQKRKYRILHLIKGLGRGGAEKLLAETIALHNGDQFEFYVCYFLSYKNQLVDDLKNLNCTVSLINATHIYQMVFKMGVLRNKIEEWGIDLIHCHLPWSGILGRFLGKQLDIPTLYTEHNLSKRYHFLTRLMNNLTIDMNSKVLAVSKDVFSDLLQNISMAKVKQLNNGVNTDKFDPDLFNKDEVRGELRIPLDSIVIGNIAVFRTQKRLDLWLTIASKLCELNTSIIFILIGDGQLKESLVKLTHRLTLCDKVIFTGSKADVRPYLAAMDIFMMTSEFEGLPIALLEAVSMKKAVAVTNAGGNKEVIENEVNGLICEVDDLDQLYMNMLRLIEDNELRLRLGTEARNTAIQKFSIHRMIKELEEAYLEQLYERS